MVKGFSKVRTKLTSMNRERVMKTRILITLLLLGASANLVLGGAPPADARDWGRDCTVLTCFATSSCALRWIFCSLPCLFFR